MKKILLVIAMIAVLMMTGCNKKENVVENNVQENQNNQQGEIVTNKGYTNEQLIVMAKEYRKSRGEYVPSIVEVDNENGDIVVIHLYDILEDHAATWDWYTVNRLTAKGTNVLEEEIDLTDIKGSNSEDIINKNTSMKSLKQKGIIKDDMEVGKNYDIGKVTINNKIYDIKYYINQFEAINEWDDSEGKITITEHKLSFFDGDALKREFVIEGGYWYSEFIKNLSIFKEKYLVCVTDTNTSDSLQHIIIYDENLEEIQNVTVHQGYDNYYSINENEILFIYTDGNEKVTSKILEDESGKLYIEEIERTTDGVIEYAGRT